ncbi:MAG: glycine/betaine/sarcosine/D-proline family reductase selenoprotein B, partial [Chloroflexi bacterium]|nr:glycine/betaine/sarcosine/D-proline family reductase selenoprotein B [Chloroflexota bacterium]
MPGERVRVVHYLNRFFAGLGGEEASSGGVSLGDGPVGAGRGLQQELGADAEVVATIYCGDTYFAEHPDDARHEVLEAVRRLRPDVLVAGPAFNAGRYGFACAEVCETVARELGIPCVTGYYPQAPGVEVYRRYRNHRVYAIPTRDVAAGMRDALGGMARLAVRVGKGEAIGPATAEGYLPRGLRREVTIERPGTERAIEMVLSKIAGARFTTEIPLVKFDDVPPASALPDLRRATIAVISTSGVV